MPRPRRSRLLKDLLGALLRDDELFGIESPDDALSESEADVCMCGCARKGHDEEGKCKRCKEACKGFREMR